MTTRKLTAQLKSQVLRRLSHSTPTSLTDLATLISGGKLPEDLKWQPSICMIRGNQTILVHILASPDFPAYLEKAINELKKFPGVYVLILARDLMLEPTEESPPSYLAAPHAAAAVAEKVLSMGCGLAFEVNRSVYLVFDNPYTVPPRCNSAEETGHVPKWLFQELAASERFSPELQQLLRRFAKRYDRATRGDSIPNEREARLLLDFAGMFAALDKRFFLPLEGLETLRNFEMSGATRARDHFFHTFNNFLLGLHILGHLSDGRKFIADVDRFIHKKARGKNLNSWEVLWFLTCMSHDPGYTAEKFWASFRFNFGILAGAGGEREMPDEVKQQIRDLWDSQYAAPRQDLHDLYNRTVRKWVPPTIARKGADLFDEAVRAAYFDGKIASHSLISGLRLINACRSQKVPRDRKFNPVAALTACEIAALCMMFHDPRCRDILQRAGIPPIPFESLPYACLLMYVDCLQDDRRDISKSRFNKHGVLASVAIRPLRVSAEVCLPEVPVNGWPGRIAEYESVMQWINAESDTRFTIDYRARAKLPA